jgi:hypothetical protein
MTLLEWDQVYMGSMYTVKALELAFPEEMNFGSIGLMVYPIGDSGRENSMISNRRRW